MNINRFFNTHGNKPGAGPATNCSNPVAARLAFPLMAVALLLLSFSAHAQQACRLADPNSLGEFVAEICWFEFGDVDTDLESGTSDVPFDFALPDGSSIELEVSVAGGSGANPRLTVFEAPTWTGSNFSGTSGFYTILTPNSAALHSPDGRGNQVVLTLADVRLFRPDGEEVDDLPFQLIMADAERLNSNPEHLDFGVISGGSPWELLEWLGNAPASAVTQGTPATLDPGVVSACLPGYVDCQRFRGETMSSDANAPVMAATRDVDSPDPFSIMGQIHSGAGQGFAVGVRWGSVRLRKVLPEGRIDPSDQFIYRLENIVGDTIEVGETTGGDTEYPYVGTMAMPGNFLTLIEEMAPGSASTLDQYDRHIVCVDEYGDGEVVLDEPYDLDTPPQVTTRHLGDGIDCTITNTPRLAGMEFTKVADPMSYSQPGDIIEYSFEILNNGTVALTDVSVEDPLLGGTVACVPDTLLPTESAVCGPVSYTVTQTDVDAGTIFNTATATALDPDDEQIEEEDSVTVTGPQHEPDLEVTKALSDAPDPIEAGSALEFTITLTNTGNVTLFDVEVEDPLLNPADVTCAEVAPGDTCVLVGEYTVTQADMDAGQFLNTGLGSGTPPPTPADPDPGPLDDEDDVTTPLPQSPALQLDKQADPVVVDAVGQEVEYSFTVTNIGNVTVSDVTVDDPMLGGAIACTPAILAPGESANCGPVTYPVTQADIDDGQIINIATAGGTDPNDDPVDSDESSVVVDVVQSPALMLVKEVSDMPDPVIVGAEIEYTITATNTGNVTLDPIVVNDDLITPDSITCPSVPPGGTCVLVGTYVLEQENIDDGIIINTADAEGTPPSGDPVTDDSKVNQPLPREPGLVLVKSADPAAFGAVGDEIDYSFTVENTGNVTLTDVEVNDPMLGGAVACVPATLEPGETANCGPVSYTVTQQDLDNGSIVNVATASATDPVQTVVEDEDDNEVPGPVHAPALEVIKSLSDAPDPIVAGSVLEYTIVATNTGNVTLAPVVVEDAMITPDSITCASVPPGGMCELVGTYEVTQADINNAEIVNTGTGSGTPPPTDGDPDPDPVEDEDETTTPIGQTPALELVKSADPVSFDQVGDMIDYSFTVTNTGNVTIDNVSVDDPLLGGTVVCAPTTLQPGESANCGPVAYTITQDDMNAGEVVNAATATGTDPDGGTLEDEDEVTVPGPGADPSLTLLKQADLIDDNGNGFADAGEIIEYTLTATNSGNVTLTGVTVDDPMIGTLVCVPVQPATLDPGDTLECTGSYEVTPDDVDAGTPIVNNAVATGTDPDGDPVEDEDDTSTPVTPLPALELQKDSDLIDDNGNGTADPGEVIEYTLTAVNTGNITLEDVIIVDEMLDDTPDGLECTPAMPATLMPGDVLVCTGSYTVTQADVDAGGMIVNHAIVSAPDPTDPECQPGGDPDLCTPVEDDVEEEVPVTDPEPGLSLVKMADPMSYSQDGDIIEYSFTVENIGNVTLADVMVDDPLLGGAVACSPSTLAPGEVASCGPVAYTVIPADIDNGQIVNVATGQGTPPATDDDPDPDPIEDTDEVTVPGPEGQPSLSVLKVLSDAPDPIVEGSVLEYTIIATNNGNITLSDVVVSDPLITPDSITCPVVAVGDDCVLVGTYTVTQADIDAGEILNTGIGQAPDPNDPDGPPVEDEDDITTPLPRTPALVLDKVITGGDPYMEVGDVISYELTATNTGNVTLINVEIIDPDVAGLDCTPAQPATLAPTESLVCTGSYTVDQGDINAGSFTNTATVSGEDPDGESVSDEDEAEALGPDAGPAMELVKTLSDAPDPIVAGSVLEFTITATNSGNVTLSEVVIEDDMITPDSEICLMVEPGETCVLTGTYEVTAADVQAGSIINVATGVGTDVDGVEVPEVDDTLTVPVSQPPPSVPYAVPVLNLPGLLLMMLVLLGLGGARLRLQGS